MSVDYLNCPVNIIMRHYLWRKFLPVNLLENLLIIGLYYNRARSWIVDIGSVNSGSPVTLYVCVFWCCLCQVLPVSSVALFPVTTWRMPSQVRPSWELRHLGESSGQHGTSPAPLPSPAESTTHPMQNNILTRKTWYLPETYLLYSLLCF